VDPDNDKDGILDAADKCPDEAETKNLYQDEDGCPDTAPVVFVTKEKIIITQKIYFRKGSDRILKKSNNVVKAVAEILKEHKEILKISVEGHTSTEGSAKGNKRLSQKRAKAIVRYLKKKGVSKKRLTSKGWGEEKPITEVPEKSKDDREKNRRVEFINLEQAPPAAPAAPAK
jgi:large repetitive protein